MGRQAREGKWTSHLSSVNGCHFVWGVEGLVPCSRRMLDDRTCGRSEHTSLNMPDIVYVSRL